MSRTKLANKRPTLKEAIEWIAHEDNAGSGDTANDIAGYISTCLVSDLFGCGQHQLASRIAYERERAGLPVGKMDPDTLREFTAEKRRELETSN